MNDLDKRCANNKPFAHPTLVLSESEEREVGRYEYLRRCANLAIWTVRLQIRRLQDTILEPDIRGNFVLQPVSDAEFLIVSLDRLLAVSFRINKMTDGSIDQVISEYQNALPNLRDARNVISHLDEYLLGDGNNKNIQIGQLSVNRFDLNQFDYAGFEFDLDKALLVAEKIV